MLIVMILVMSCCVYTGISCYYSYHFFLEYCFINGIDSSNKTAYEVEQVQGKRITCYSGKYKDAKEPQTITGKDIDYQYVSSRKSFSC